jgi:hypothetical protein
MINSLYRYLFLPRRLITVITFSIVIIVVVVGVIVVDIWNIMSFDFFAEAMEVALFYFFRRSTIFIFRFNLVMNCTSLLA